MSTLSKILTISLLAFTTPLFAGSMGPMCPPADQPQPPLCLDTVKPYTK